MHLIVLQSIVNTIFDPPCPVLVTNRVLAQGTEGGNGETQSQELTL
jgi:hypothetical protein